MKHLSIFIAVLFGLTAFTACAPRWVRTPVIDQKEIVISLEHKIANKQVVKQRFDHPFKIDQQKLKTLLTQLKYIDKPIVFKKSEEKQVFQETEIERLAPAMAEALAKADPDQRVRFVSHNRGGGLLFTRQRQTSGVAFVQPENRLNLAFSDVNFALLTSDVEDFSRDDDSRDPLRISSSFTPITAPDYVEHRLTEKGGTFPMWIAVDVDKIAAAPAAEPAPAPSLPVPAPAAMPEPEKPMVEQPAPASKTPALPPDDSWETRKQDHREKLQYLKELYESGLIDEEEYKEQKKKLLNQL